MDESMITRAKEVDEILGLDAQGPKQQQLPGKKNKNKRVLDVGADGRPNGAMDNKKQRPQEPPGLASRSEFGNVSQVTLAA
jgi:hypothetical protein